MTQDLRLGRRPSDPERPVLNMGAHLRVGAFAPPSGVDYTTKVRSWILGHNDRFGTCGPVSVANLALLVSSLVGQAPVRFTDEEIFDLYRRSGNSRFDPALAWDDPGQDDNGVEMTVMLSELVKNGIGFGDRNVKALAFGIVDARDEAKVFAAGALFGGVLVGADLDQSQGDQFDAGQVWDYAPSGTWGGHAMAAAMRYTDQSGTLADRTGLVTWATLTSATDEFFDRQVPECYVVLFPWHLSDRRIFAGLDLAGVAHEYERLTGRAFPAPVEPEPVPQAPALNTDVLDAWAQRRAWWWPKYERDAADAYLEWRTSS